jgi:hypothetical protein
VFELKPKMSMLSVALLLELSTMFAGITRPPPVVALVVWFSPPVVGSPPFSPLEKGDESFFKKVAEGDDADAFSEEELLCFAPSFFVISLDHPPQNSVAEIYMPVPLSASSVPPSPSPPLCRRHFLLVRLPLPMPLPPLLLLTHTVLLLVKALPKAFPCLGKAASQEERSC